MVQFKILPIRHEYYYLKSNCFTHFSDFCKFHFWMQNVLNNYLTDCASCVHVPPRAPSVFQAQTSQTMRGWTHTHVFETIMMTSMAQVTPTSPSALARKTVIFFTFSHQTVIKMRLISDETNHARKMHNFLSFRSVFHNFDSLSKKEI